MFLLRGPLVRLLKGQLLREKPSVNASPFKTTKLLARHIWNRLPKGPQGDQTAKRNTPLNDAIEETSLCLVS